MRFRASFDRRRRQVASATCKLNCTSAHTWRMMYAAGMLRWSFSFLWCCFPYSERLTLSFIIKAILFTLLVVLASGHMQDDPIPFRIIGRTRESAGCGADGD